jgi:hypothetical protein
VLSPPQADSMRHAVPTMSAAPNPFISPLNASAARSVTAHGRNGHDLWAL